MPSSLSSIGWSRQEYGTDYSGNRQVCKLSNSCLYSSNINSAQREYSYIIYIPIHELLELEIQLFSYSSSKTLLDSSCIKHRVNSQRPAQFRSSLTKFFCSHCVRKQTFWAQMYNQFQKENLKTSPISDRINFVTILKFCKEVVTIKSALFLDFRPWLRQNDQISWDYQVDMYRTLLCAVSSTLCWYIETAFKMLPSRIQQKVKVAYLQNDLLDGSCRTT